ncbi:Metabotropic glutamate receptor 2 [Taenia solium]|eukprot:TsM_001058600 transcript=TsM_001058600 gene=TsM_001058600
MPNTTKPHSKRGARQSQHNYNNLVAFDENGDGVGQYLIYNYARDLYSGEYQYRLVGDYKNSKLSMRYRPIWPGGQSKLVPSSQCSEECP